MPSAARSCNYKSAFCVASWRCHPLPEMENTRLEMSLMRWERCVAIAITRTEGPIKKSIFCVAMTAVITVGVWKYGEIYFLSIIKSIKY